MPEGARRRPVVIVVPEIFGLHEYIRDVARRLAKAGYVGVAFDPFVRAGDPSKLSESAPIIAIVETATDVQVMGDIRAVISWLGTNPKLGREPRAARVRFADMRRVGITGFCWGGAVVWMACARIPQIKAGVAWYGRLVRPAPTAFLGKEERQWPVDVAGGLKAPVLGLYAGEDRGIPLSDVEAMQAALAAADSESRIEIFPGVAHGFHADYRAVYDKAAAEAGWARLLDWFAKRL
jgi:carboxymethylenebutenolidase